MVRLIDHENGFDHADSGRIVNATDLVFCFSLPLETCIEVMALFEGWGDVDDLIPTQYRFQRKTPADLDQRASDVLFRVQDLDDSRTPEGLSERSVRASGHVDRGDSRSAATAVSGEEPVGVVI
jgi:hypothetical protein